MEIFKSGVDLLQLGVTAMGGGAVLMGMLNIFESLSSDNPGPRAQGMRQAFGGGAVDSRTIRRGVSTTRAAFLYSIRSFKHMNAR